MPSVDVSIVIPVFNKFDLTRNCLKSLAEHAPEAAMEVLVVDNGSADETAGGLGPLGRSLFGDGFVRIRFEENRNFGPACNEGAALARGGNLFFLNNDTLLTPGWYGPLAENLDGKCGLVGPLLVYPKAGDMFRDRVQHLGVACSPQLYPVHLYEFFPVSHPVVGKRRVLQFVTGAAMMVQKDVFSAVGGFCEEYVNGGEDLDLCVAIRELGHEVRCEISSRIYHLLSQTPGRHDHEGHNAEVFKRRCVGRIFPDLHRHLAQDGYEIGLNEFLTAHARLPADRRRVLRRHFERMRDSVGQDDILGLMEREPLFEPPYDRLVELYEARGDLPLVADVFFLKFRLFPGRANASALLLASARAGRADMEGYARGILEYYDGIDRDMDLPGVAEDMIRYCRLIKMSELADLYGDWLGKDPGAAAL